jgi:HD-GYP domain-containing protein (c-di-GMP phosphodiesterase class II)
VSAPIDALDLQTELVAASRERVVAPLQGRELWTHATTALLFSVAAAFLAAAQLPSTVGTWLLAGLFAAALALASRIELEVGSGFATPVEVLLMPALFALPAGCVPFVVAVGLVAGQAPSFLRRAIHPDRVIIAVGNASSSLAPALVFVLMFDPDASPGQWAAVTLIAVIAQFLADGVISALRERLAVGVDPRSLVEPFVWILTTDACLAPVGFAVALAGQQWTPAYMLSLPLLLLIRRFAQERAGRLTHALELSAAYRGTALLLGDVVEADDRYTGAHSRDVVDLATAVADHLGLDVRARHLVEMTALLHDVGKIRIPNSIITKPGPLTPEERRIINTHTIEGERLLSQVGGLLAEVGTIVRSCHERYDGGGYPDGLAGQRIPLVARIICCCDAYSAMTTDRPYRAAMRLDEARAELLRNRGTQFDPNVVGAILAVTADFRDADATTLPSAA